MNAKKRAVVAAVARKLSVLLHRLWVSGEIYEPPHNAHRRQEEQEAAYRERRETRLRQRSYSRERRRRSQKSTAATLR
jgi:hypothetical protein